MIHRIKKRSGSGSGTGTGLQMTLPAGAMEAGTDDDFEEVDEAKPPESIGSYMIKNRIGSGAFATVYRAIDPSYGKEVALKVPHPGAIASERAVTRFMREASSLARLRHPNIVPFFEVIQGATGPVLATGLIVGSTLAQVLEAHGPMSPRRASATVSRLAAALAHAHEAGIIHRDVKPSNILVDVKGRPYLTDFGLARLVDGRAKLTRAGAILGTPAYLSPEQAQGDLERVGPASDQYSLGVTLYELLAGRPPFDGPTHAVLYQAVSQAPPPPSQFRPDIPPALEEICLKAMARRPEDRFADCQALCDTLKAWAEAPAPSGTQPTEYNTSTEMSGLDLAIRTDLPEPTVDTEGEPERAGPRSGRRIWGPAAAASLLIGGGASYLFWPSTGTVPPLQALQRGAAAPTPASNPVPISRPKVDQGLARAGGVDVRPPDNSLVTGPQTTSAQGSVSAIARPAVVMPATVPQPVTPTTVSRDVVTPPKIVNRPAESPAPSPKPDSEAVRAYAEQLKRAQAALGEKRPADALRILDSCPAPLRGWEWRHLHAMAGPLPGADIRLTPKRAARDVEFAADSSRLAAYTLERSGKDRGISLELWSALGVPVESTPGRILANDRDFSHVISAKLNDRDVALQELPDRGKPILQGRFQAPYQLKVPNARLALIPGRPRILMLNPYSRDLARAGRSSQGGGISEETKFTITNIEKNEDGELEITRIGGTLRRPAASDFGAGTNPGGRDPLNTSRVFHLQLWPTGGAKPLLNFPEVIGDKNYLIFEAAYPAISSLGNRVAVKVLTETEKFLETPGTLPKWHVLLYEFRDDEKTPSARLIQAYVADQFGFSPSGDWLATVDTKAKRIQIHSAKDGQPFLPPPVKAGQSSWTLPGTNFDFRRDGKQIATWGDGIPAYVWNLDAAAKPQDPSKVQPIYKLDPKAQVLFGPGDRITSLGPDGTTILDPSTGLPLLTIPGLSTAASSSPDGHRLALVQDGKIQLRSDAAPPSR